MNLEEELLAAIAERNSARAEVTRLSNYETAHNNLRLVVRSQYGDIARVEEELSQERARFQDLLKEYSDRMVEVREERSNLLVSRQEEQDRLSRLLAALPAIIFGVVYYDLGEHGVTWERCVEVWNNAYVPALAEEHFGDCTKQPQACIRCQAEDVMRMADVVRKGLSAWLIPAA